MTLDDLQYLENVDPMSMQRRYTFQGRPSCCRTVESGQGFDSGERQLWVRRQRGDGLLDRIDREPTAQMQECAQARSDDLRKPVVGVDERRSKARLSSTDQHATPRAR